MREQYDFTGESQPADTDFNADVDTAVDTAVDTGVLLDSERHKQRHRKRLEKRVLSKDIAQVHLCLGGVALPYGHPSKYALFLLNALLGGGMTSRLFQKIREEAGLAYSIYSDLDFYRDTGQICISAGVDPKDAQRAVDLIRQECRVLCEQSVPEDELRDTRSQLTGSLYLSLEESGSVMNRLARAEIYENTHASVDETVRKLEEVTTADIAELAGTVFTAEKHVPDGRGSPVGRRYRPVSGPGAIHEHARRHTHRLDPARQSASGAAKDDPRIRGARPVRLRR